MKSCGFAGHTNPTLKGENMDVSGFRTCAIGLVACGCFAGDLFGQEAEGVIEVPRFPEQAAHASLPETLRDVLAHLPPKDAAAARDPKSPEDLVTWAHEATHFVNSRLSTTKTRGFYTLFDQGWRLPLTKRTTLTHVADAIPEKLRGRTFKTYLIDSRRDWDTYPLYLFDELVAYQSGTIVRQELGWAKRRETEEFMAELAIYAAYMVEVVAHREPEYPVEELREFRAFLLERSRIIATDFDNLPLVKQCDLLEEMK